MCLYIFLTKGLSSSVVEKVDRMTLFVLFVFASAVFSVCIICMARHIYLCMLYMCACVHVYWEYILSPATGWTRRH